ncbi:MAG: hypothetical protein K5695_04580 [Oscillospiraceae bacterium]|nr:hypothetical protein [Oscillospiraceae bacterium]
MKFNDYAGGKIRSITAVMLFCSVSDDPAFAVFLYCDHSTSSAPTVLLALQSGISFSAPVFVLKMQGFVP